MKCNFYQYIFILIGYTFVGCNSSPTINSNYAQNPNISKPNNEPIDSLTNYFPFNIKKDSSIIQTNLDSFDSKWYSMALFDAKEKILFNYYGGHDLYRFLWLRAFHPPIIISLNKDANNVWIEFKVLDKHPPVVKLDTSIKFVGPNGEIDTTNYHIRDSINMAYANGAAKIAASGTVELSDIEWTKFEDLLILCDYYKMAPFIQSFGIDGSNWIIEAHLKNKYWVVDRWSPKDSYRKCGEYLIDLSGLREERY